MSDLAPVDTMTVLATYVGSAASGSPTQILNGRSEKSTLVALTVSILAPNRSAWERKFIMSSGPITPSGKPGKFSTSVVNMS